MNDSNKFRLAIDIGGTFTDTVLVDKNGKIVATNKTPPNITSFSIDKIFSLFIKPWFSFNQAIVCTKLAKMCI
jgi:predicted NBD/HSP70 family sugar kinase